MTGYSGLYPALKNRKEETYVDRMIAEHKELNERVRKIKEKISDSNFINAIGTEKANLLIAQYHAMETYGFLLAQRICLEDCGDFEDK